MTKAISFIEAVEKLNKQGDNSTLFKRDIRDLIDFYNHPFSLDMLCNPLEKPMEKDYIFIDAYNLDLELWQEAEAKVIFKGWEYLTGSDKYMLINRSPVNDPYFQIEKNDRYSITIGIHGSFFLPIPLTIGDYINDFSRLKKLDNLEFTDSITDKYFNI